MPDINHQSLYHALDTAKSMANSYEKTKSAQELKKHLSQNFLTDQNVIKRSSNPSI